MRSLWLTSWYPNKLDSTNGDFIQRHAKAAAMYCKIDVLHFEADHNNRLTKDIESSFSQNGNLSEKVLFFKAYKKYGVIGKLFTIIRYIKLFKKEIKNYIDENGKPDVVHVHVIMKAGLLALWLKRKYKISYVVTEHWAIYNYTAKDAYYKRNPLFKYFTKKILKNASAFLPVSKNLGEAIQQMVAPVAFTVVPNVADTNVFNITYQKKSEAFRFMHASTLNYQKNPEGIIRTYAKFCAIYPDTELIIAGACSEVLLHFIKKAGIPEKQLKLTGWLFYEQVAVELKKSHALVMFSRFENLPCIIIEALCCGLPVISSDVGGIPELINDANGILIPNEDEGHLYNAMEKIYKDYNSYSTESIAASAIQKFSYERIGKTISDVYVFANKAS